MRPHSGLGRPVVGVSKSCSVRQATISWTSLEEGSAQRRDLYLTRDNTHKRHPCPRRDSNPQSQQTSGRRPKHYTTWPRESAQSYLRR
jgi:hypothetical protein